MQRAKKMLPTITVWKLRSPGLNFHVRIKGLSGYERQAPFKFCISDKKIGTKEKKHFGVLYSQICQLIRLAIKQQRTVSQAVKGCRVKKTPPRKVKITIDAYLHQLRCEEAGAC